MIRCDSCGASNPDGAAWCGQCLASLANDGAPSGRPAATTITAPVSPTSEAGTTGQTPEASALDEAGAVAEVTTRGFRRRPDGEMEWACAGCGEYNPIGVDVCSVCGTPFSARWAQPEPPPPPPSAFSNALLSSVVLPGSGHLSLKRTGSGVLRLLLFVSWALGAIVLIAAGGPVLMTAGPLIAGALAVWALTIGDVLRLRSGEPELLRGRTVVWLVVGVIGLEVVGLLAASLTLA